MWYGLDWRAALLASRYMALLVGMATACLAVCTNDLHGYLATNLHARAIG